MRIPWKTIFIVCLLLTSLAMVPFLEDFFQPPVPLLVSASAEWDDMYAVAQQWHPDAYLYKLEIPLEKGFSDWKIVASFRFSSLDFLSILLYWNDKSSYEIKPIQHTIPIDHKVGITRADWPIDSPQAIKLLVEQKPSNYFADLYLEILYPKDEQIIIWRLTTVAADGYSSAKHYRIDARTGDVVTRRDDD